MWTIMMHVPVAHQVSEQGKCGEAYNIADPNSVASIREIAKLIAGEVGRKVCF